jgi:hypothetical protein
MKDKYFNQYQWTKQADSWSNDRAVHSAINVCPASTNFKPLHEEEYLKQSCHLKGTEQHTCENNDDDSFECNGGDIKNSPFPNFVCYELGNDCFRNPDINFEEKQLDQWKYGWLPPGVRIVTYGYPITQMTDTKPFIGRNPRYQHRHEKLIWNGTFFNRIAANYDMEKSAGTLSGIVFESASEVIDSRRRLLEFDYVSATADEIIAHVRDGITNIYTKTFYPVDSGTVNRIPADDYINKIKFGRFDDWYYDQRGDRPLVEFDDLWDCSQMQMGKDYDYIAERHFWQHTDYEKEDRCMPCAWRPEEYSKLKPEWFNKFHSPTDPGKICKSGKQDDCCQTNDNDGKLDFEHDEGFISCGSLTDTEKNYFRPLCRDEDNKDFRTETNYLKCASFVSTFCRDKDSENQVIPPRLTIDFLSDIGNLKPMVTWEVNKIAAPIWQPLLWNGFRTCESSQNGDYAVPSTCKEFRTLEDYNGAKTYPPWFNCIAGPVQPVSTEGYNVKFLRNILENTENDGLFFNSNGAWISPYGEYLRNAMGNDTPNRENKKIIFKKFMTDFEKKWFDYSALPHYRIGMDVHMEAENHRHTTNFWFPYNYKSFSLALMEGFTCDRAACQDGISTAVEVRKGLFHCVGCSKTSRGAYYCKGRHKCMVRNLKLSDENGDLYQSAMLSSPVQRMHLDSLFDKHASTNMLSLSDTATVLFLCLTIQFREFLQEEKDINTAHLAEDVTSYTYLTAEEQPTNMIDWKHPASWKYNVYSTTPAFNWEQTTGTPSNDPLTGKSVMQIRECLSHSETDQVAYGRCSQDESLQTLKKGLKASFNKTGGALLYPSQGMIIPVDSSQLLSDTLLGWSHHNRLLRDQYLEWLFTLEKHCAQGKQTESVCRVSESGKTITLFNPWVGGDFSVAQLCDARRHDEGFSDVVDSAGNRLCQPGGPYSDFFDHQVSSCKALDGSPVTTRMVPKTSRIPGGAGVNLCNLTPRRNTTCEHRQSLLGGFRGSPVDTLYHPQRNLGIGEMGGIFVAPRIPIFRRTSDSFNRLTNLEESILKVDPRDIAGHHMRFVVTENDIFRLDELLLPGIEKLVVQRQSEAKKNAGKRNPHPSYPRGDVNSWLQWDESTENILNVLHEPDIGPGNQHWTCPIRQRIFLSGMNARFRPKLPSGRRAAVMFSVHHDSTQRVNTVQASGDADVYVHANMRTTNGFCVCQQSVTNTNNPYVNCRQSIQTSNECGFLQTISSLYDKNWRSSMVGKGNNRGGCVEQLDWPYTGGKLRDGRHMTLSRDLNRTECNLLDRLPAFQYRYTYLPIADASKMDDTFHSVQGNCHGSRVYSTTKEEGLDFLQDACFPITESINMSHMELSCTQKNGGVKYRKTLSVLRYPVKVNNTMPAQPKTQRPRAVRCSQCAAPPKFFEGTGTREIIPESSYGVPFREDPERVIAGSVRNNLARVLCGAQDRECLRLEKVLNVSSWVPDIFWEKFLTNVSDLFLETVSSVPSVMLPNRTVYDTFTQAATEAETDYNTDLDLWEVPWVWCTQTPSVCTEECDAVTGVCEKSCTFATETFVPGAFTEFTTGSSRTARSIDRCSGTIPKDQWMNVNTRGAACKTGLQKMQTSMNLTAAVDVCDMDRSMNTFCSILQAARNEIFSANCFAAGVCYREKFYYQPSVYSLSNQAFVRSTVQNFYLQINESACPERDASLQSTLDQNFDLVRECPATTLEVFVIIINGLRNIIDKMIRLAYFTLMIGVTMIRFVVQAMVQLPGVDQTELSAELEMWFQLWAKEMAAMWIAVGEMIYKLVMDSEFGSFLASMIEACCAIINWFIDFFVLTLWCGILTAVETYLYTYAFILEKLIIFQFLVEPMRAAALGVQNYRLDSCTPDVLLQCKDLFPVPAPQIANLPTSTRCWSTYVTSLGDANSLSCSAADTCLSANLGGNGYTSEFSNQKDKQMCATCETPTLGFTRFGCDLARKQCKCNVQTLSRTACINHDECASTVRNDATCDLLDHSLDVSNFGTTPCRQCTSQPICLVDIGERVGHCACSIKQVEFATCSNSEIGNSMFPAIDSLCLVTLGTAIQEEMQASTDMQTTYGVLAAARCDMIDQSQRYCMLVSSTAWDRFPLVVGLSGLQQGGRRLLTAWSVVVDADLYDITLNAADWADVQHTSCRYVPILAHPEISNHTLGIADTELLQSCVRWRAVGKEVITALNLTGIPDTFLLSIDDFTNDIVTQPANLYTIFISKPHTLLRAMLHMQAFQPVRTLIRQCKWWVVHAIIEASSTMQYASAGEGVNSKNMKQVLSSFSYIEHVYNVVARYFRFNSKTILRNTTIQIALYDQIRSELNGTLFEFMDSAPFVFVHKSSTLHVNNQSTTNTSESQLNQTTINTSNGNTFNMRQLLQNSFIENIASTQLYSWDVALGDGATQVIKGSTSEEFLRGDTEWPPKYVYWDDTVQCPVFTNTWGVVARSSTLLYKFYTNQGPTPTMVIYDLGAAFPDIKKYEYDISNQTLDNADTGAQPNFITWIQDTLLQYASYLGLTQGLVGGIYKQLPGTVADFFTCDVEAVMFCSQHKVSLIASSIVVAVFMMLIVTIVGYILPSTPLNSLAVLSFVTATMYYSFGISPVCAPMIPTCLIKELIYTVDTVFPASVTIPQSFEKSVGCANEYYTLRDTNETQASLYNTADCVVSCSEPPFHFTDWYSNIAWYMCDFGIDIDSCVAARVWLQEEDNWLAYVLDIVFGMETSSNTLTALWRSAVVLKSHDTSMITAYRWCSVLTSWHLVPYLIFIVPILSIVPFLLVVLFAFLTGLVRVVVAVFAMSHTYVTTTFRESALRGRRHPI